MKNKKKKKNITLTGETEARGRLLSFLFFFLFFSSCCGSILSAAGDNSINECLRRLEACCLLLGEPTGFPGITIFIAFFFFSFLFSIFFSFLALFSILS